MFLNSTAQSRSLGNMRGNGAVSTTSRDCITYPRESLTGVYFGPNITPDMIEIICLILQGQNPTVRFWRGKRSEVSFKVEFEEFFYTSSPKAEELGLRT
ncbi:hypothetical protein L4C37_13075 [Vibrio kagoshimensis]|uniref:hypothetical protein n=1 Tax=Vibrio kagoshimensis TaxID=2910244 RepID=UPI003D23ED05